MAPMHFKVFMDPMCEAHPMEVHSEPLILSGDLTHCLAVVKLLQLKTTVRSLEVMATKDEMPLIAEGIQKSEIRALKLKVKGRNFVTSIAKALWYNTTVQSLVLEDVGNVADEGIGAVATLLKKNTTLRSLTLSGHILNGVALAEALKSNTVLVSLTLEKKAGLAGGSPSAFLFSGFQMEDDAVAKTALAMKEALKHNFTLQYLTLHPHCEDPFQPMQFPPPATATIDCDKPYKMDAETKAAIADMLQRNKELVAQWSMLWQIARYCPDSGFQSLKNLSFRQEILSFFLPKFPRAIKYHETSLRKTGGAVVEQAGEDELARESPGSDSDEKGNKAVHFSKVLQLSRADRVSVSDNGQVVLRINRMAHARSTRDTLLHSPTLEYCRARVLDADCELAPKWAGGAICFVPFTEGQLVDLKARGHKLESHHVLALRSDIGPISAAFAKIPGSKRLDINDEKSDKKRRTEAEKDAEENSEEDEEELVTVEEVWAWPSTA
eukprot:TRINITY_DN80176_c0_g1_i1.p1 TRINITY_DN80176_c0_g1~~TRINITY_DN80176_c0_g1_i1.p1  ORF type:complete len:504 (+),score=88.61 TRINITY_DN80176_c0_g1_i1:29-1513(+)